MNCPFCNHEQIKKQIFFESENFYSIYNIKPILPGHSLIITKDHVKSFLDLDESQLKDFFHLLNKTVNVLKEVYDSEGFDFALQEGKGAGQSIPHFHFHIVPRKTGDMEDPDRWYIDLMKRGEERIISDKEIMDNISKIKKALK